MEQRVVIGHWNPVFKPDMPNWFGFGIFLIYLIIITKAGRAELRFLV